SGPSAFIRRAAGSHQQYGAILLYSRPTIPSLLSFSPLKHKPPPYAGDWTLHTFLCTHTDQRKRIFQSLSHCLDHRQIGECLLLVISEDFVCIVKFVEQPGKLLDIVRYALCGTAVRRTLHHIGEPAQFREQCQGLSIYNHIAI